MCLVGAVLLCPVLASAQQGRPSGGNGFKVGDGRLHPFLDLETRVDSGAGYFPPPGSTSPEDLPSDLGGEFIFHIRPGFKLEVPSPRLALNLTAQADYLLYSGLLTPASKSASHLQGMADLSARFNPEGVLGVELTDHFTRSDRTRTAAVGAGVLSLYNELRLNVPFRPGGGAIEITPEASWAVEFFESLGALRPVGCTEGVCDPVALETFDYNNVRLGLDGRWRFLPKTALVVDTDFDLRSYFGGTTPNAQLMRAMVGLAGLVSPKISVTAKAGWGQNFGASGGGTFLAQLEGTYLMSPTMTFKGGYLRTLEPVSAYSLFRDDRGYVEGRALFGGKLAVHGAVAYDLLSFASATAPRSDNILTVDVGPEYQFRPWLVGAAGYTLNTRSSSVTGSGINYTRHEGYVRVSVSY
jgi:hypothetical protein